MSEPPKMAQPTEGGRARFDALVDELKSELDIVGASMFGMPSMKRRGGKAFAGCPPGRQRPSGPGQIAPVRRRRGFSSEDLVAHVHCFTDRATPP
jgi:hypothetical protein